MTDVKCIKTCPRLGLCLGFILCASVAADDRLATILKPLRYDRTPEIAEHPLASGYVLDQLYKNRDYEPIWNQERYDVLLTLLAEAPSHGLRAADFHSGTLRGLGSALGAEDDILATDGLLRYLVQQRHGRVNPSTIDRTWRRVKVPAPDSLVQMLEQIVEAQDLAQSVRGLIAKPAFYEDLRAARVRAQQIADAGGWGEVTAGQILSLGVDDPRVPQVRARLRLSGDWADGDLANSRFDEPLQAAVMAFQRRHLLSADGVVGPRTLAALNVPVERRLEQIELNLERMRWIVADLPPDYVLVDIAAANVGLVRDGEQIWTGRAVVGKPERKTPSFRDELEHLVINPTWTVPRTILAKDIIPKARKNPSYVRKKGLEVINRRGKVVSPESVNWTQSAGSFPYTLRQGPGKRNALGRIKFMFPNDYSVYLHDTPSRHLFRSSNRTRSSGCVRVERPLELAELVLNQPQRWSSANLKHLLKTNKTRWLHLDMPLPVLLAYWTAEGIPGGRVSFKRDVYNWDKQSLAALKRDTQTGIAYVKPEPMQPPALGLELESESASKSETESEPRSEPATSPGTEQQTAQGPRTVPMSVKPPEPISEPQPTVPQRLETRLRGPQAVDPI